MRAWLSRHPGGPLSLVLEELPRPSFDRTDVLVRVQAVGVNYPDGLFIRDLYQFKPPRPFVPGSEFSGIVAEVGPDVVDITPGDHVVGASGFGAMAEYISMPAAQLFKVPDTIAPVDAASFVFTYATAIHALRDAADVQSGETVLVLGAAGGIGTATIDVATAFGARVIAAASSTAKVGFAVENGASAGVMYPPSLDGEAAQREFVAAIRTEAPRGVDIVVDPVGGSFTEPALRSLRRGGRHLVVGFTAGIPSVQLNIALLRSARIIGVDWRTFIQAEPEKNRHNLDELFALWKADAIQPHVTEIFEFDQAPDAIARLESRASMGKVVISVDD